MGRQSPLVARPPRTVKVAVVGSGLAGLTAAHLVATSSTDDVEFEVHLFEKSAVLGMDSHSVSIPILQKGEGSEILWRVDVPMRSFQGGYYPQLIALYKAIGVKFRQSDFSYSFSKLTGQSENRSITTFMIYNGASGRAGISMPSAFWTSMKGTTYPFHFISNILAVFMFIGSTLLLAFNYIRISLLSAPPFRPAPDLTFGDWVEHSSPKGILARTIGLDAKWREFCMAIIVPLFSAVCTAPSEDILAHPVQEFLDYIWLTLFTHHYVVMNGVRDVVRRLAEPVHHVHTSTPIISMQRDPQDPSKVSISTGPDSWHAGFSHVVFATQANSAVPLLSSYCASLSKKSQQRPKIDDLLACLRSFTYRRNIVVNHTDGTIMPDCAKDRRDLNLIDALHLEKHDANDVCVPTSFTMATHVLPLPSHLKPLTPAYYQTTNPIIPPTDGSIISVTSLERAVLTVEAKKALQDLAKEERKWWQSQGRGRMSLGKLQGAGRRDSSAEPGIWFCGSYAHGGIPLLEGCVVSAKNVVNMGILPCEGLIPKPRGW
ncbi:hypothetical protein BD410DRAFT_781495 [Rickenella mellea]|uniref:FAD/NAD(P)-binding domain-containing protein n=1 Tax=Rickenella mellea TaxID=50990 RepID=A0A4Y7QNG4_9AGAM|nr:hypothetical protein BD410DRAFT_781495 [Rickenella mellea]